MRNHLLQLPYPDTRGPCGTQTPQQKKPLMPKTHGVESAGFRLHVSSALEKRGMLTARRHFKLTRGSNRCISRTRSSPAACRPRRRAWIACDVGIHFRKRRRRILITVQRRWYSKRIEWVYYSAPKWALAPRRRRHRADTCLGRAVTVRS